MAGEHKREGSALETGVDKGLPPITAAGDDLEKMNAVGGADDKVNRKKKKPSEGVVKLSDNDQATQKKPRFIWTRELHKLFLDAVKHLGFKTAVPTKILELMNVEDLTRENVASQLQKYRLQMKRRDQEQAQARAASGNVSKPMSGIPQQPWVLPNTMQGINMECACLDRSQLAPSFANHNLNMIQGFPSIQEVYGTPFKDLGVNRMSSVRLVHGLYDSDVSYDINKFVHNYGPLPPKPLVDSYVHNLMDRSYFHDTTLVPLYDRLHESSLADQGIISPSLVHQYDRRDELSLADLGIISPSFVPQYDRRDELSVADQGIISPSLAQEGLGIGMPRLHEATGGLIGIGLGARVPRLPKAAGGLAGMKVKGIGQLGVGVPHLPEATGGLFGMKVEGLGVGATHPLEATRGLAGMKVKELGGVGVGVSSPPEAIGGLVGMKVEGFGVGIPRPPSGGFDGRKVEGLGGVGVGMPRPPDAIGGLAGMKVEGLGLDMRRPPEATGGLMKVEGFGVGVPRLAEKTGGLAGMNDFPQGFSLDKALDLTNSWMNMKGDDVDGKSIDDLFWR